MIAGSRHFVAAGLISLAAFAAGQNARAQALARPPEGLLLIDAIRESLKQNVNTLLQQQQVVSNQGQVLQAQGPFDPLVNASVVRSRVQRTLRTDELTALEVAGIYNVLQDKTDATTNQIGINKMFLNGVSLGAAYGITSTTDVLENLQSIGRQTTGQLSFTLKVPLLKNFGRDTVGAQLDAADAQLQASQYSLLFTNAQTVLGTTVDYWDYLSKQKSLVIARGAEASAITLVEQLRKLISADQLPASDIDLAVANRAEKTANRVAAEQAVVDSRRTLARQMGVSVERMRLLPSAADEYPDFAPGRIDLVKDTDRLVQQALEKRADLEADRRLELAAGYLVVAARNNLKPELDFNAGGGYAGLAEGAPATAYERAFYTGRYSPSFNISLSLQWPVGNSQARGVLVAQLAQQSAAQISTHDLAATIASNVTTQVVGLQRSVEQLAEGIEAVRRYTIAVQNELTKRRLGTATLLDVLNTEDRLTNAQLNEVLYRQTYANAIAQLRFETGGLVRKDGDVFDVRVRDVLYPDFVAEK
jgi:outer membrane protein TolC